MKHEYYPKGVCSRKIDFEIKEGKINNLVFTGGCNGNLQGISRLAEGKPAEEIAQLLEGVSCGGRPTSCPDQFAKALHLALEKEAVQE